MRHFVLLIIICAAALNAAGQQAAPVALSKLQSCEIAIKINPATLMPEMNIVDSLKDIELVWVVVGSRDSVNLSSVQRKAVFQTAVKKGKAVVFLMPVNRVTKSGAKISGVYPNWDLINGLRFYNAACFYETIKHLYNNADR